MTKHFQILIIGGGNAGLSVAAQLLRERKDLSIGVVEPSDKIYYQPAWTLVGAGVYDIDKTVRSMQDFIPDGASWIRDAALRFDPAAKRVVCESGAEYTYSILVLCPGIRLDWEAISGLKETLGKNNVSSNYSFAHAPYTWDMIRRFEGGTAVFTNPSSPIKCGGAPHKIMYLAADYWRRKGILDRCDIHYLSGGSVLFGVKEYAATLEKVVQERNIKLHLGAVVTAIDGATGTIFYDKKNESGTIEKHSMHFDFCHAVPPQSAPDCIRESELADASNPYGYAEIDKHTMQHSRFASVFALGDCTNAPCSKTGAAIRKQAPVVVRNILSVLAGQPLQARYEGYSACPIPTEYGKLMLAEFDYSNTPKMTFPFDQAKPRRSMWFLKTRVLPWLYWHKILRGKA